MHLSHPVAKAAVGSKVVVLLLLVYFLMYFLLFVGVLCLFLFCYALFCVNSSFSTILKRKRKLVVLPLLSYICYCKCSVALPHSTLGWSAVRDCGIS